MPPRYSHSFKFSIPLKSTVVFSYLNVCSNYVAAFTSSPQLIFAAENFVTELLTKKEIDPTSPLDSYVSTGEWNSNGNFESWNCNDDISNATVINGNLIGKIVGNNPQLSLNPRNADKYVYLSSGSVVEVKCRYDAGTSNTFLQWFINYGAWQVKFKNIKKINDGKFHVYRATLLMDLGEMKSFTLNSFDKNSMGESFAIDYIRIKSPLMINPTNAANSKFIYTSLAEWNTNGYFENWTVNNATNFTVSNGVLSAKSSGNGDIQIVKSVNNGLPELNLDLAANKIIEFRIKRSDTSKNIEIYCGTENNPNLSSATRIKILATPMPQKNKFYTYRLDMSKYKQWKSKLKTLRLDPVTTSGITIDIDYIRIGQIIANE